MTDTVTQSVIERENSDDERETKRVIEDTFRSLRGLIVVPLGEDPGRDDLIRKAWQSLDD